MLNLSLILEESARRHASKAAFVFMDTTLSYSEINAQANRVANGLRAIGVEAGDKVALTCPNVLTFPMLYYGILKAGAVVVPLSVLLSAEEIEYQLNDCDAKAYCCYTGTADMPMGERGYAAFLRAERCKHFFMIMPKPGMPASMTGLKTFDDLVHAQPPHFETYQTNSDDTGVIIYTSGTTGRPKGAELTHMNLWFMCVGASGVTQSQVSDVVLVVLPLFHVFGMQVMMNTHVYKGSAMVLLPRFEPGAVFDAMQKHRVTVFGGVPTMYWSLLHHEQPNVDYKAIAANLRICVCGGSSLPVKVLEDFERRFDVQIMEGYGMSESTCVVSFNQLDVGKKVGSVGTPIPAVEVKIVDANGASLGPGEKGELAYRGPNVMKGYYKKPEETKKVLKNGWMHSGDVAVKDEDGFFFIVDRTKDMIIRGGLNVYPREVEEVMIKHAAVSLVAVIGIPHESLGEEVKACVVLKENQTVSETDLMTWTKEHVAAYKYPRHIEFLPALPMTATGKILKRELRK